MSSKGKNNQSDEDHNVEVFKVRKLIKSLEAAKGNGTSMISLIVPPKEQVSRVNKMLTDEYGTASNIKNRVNRQSVLSAITSTQAKLKLYNSVPPNGLVIYCGTVITDEGKEKLVNIDFEPFKEISTSLYLCDNRFHTEALQELLSSDSTFGFIVMDGNGTLYGTLSGNARNVLQKFTVELPKKHGRGGQSAVRFARLRDEKRHNYVRKVAENAVKNFIENDAPNVNGLILAGSADFKNDLNGSDLFDGRLKDIVIKVVDTSYGGENGFNQAIELAAESLANVKFIQEKKLIQGYFDEISMDTGKYCFGIEDTMKAMEMGAAETVIAWENLELNRYTFRDPEEDSTEIKFLSKKQEEDISNFQSNNGVDLEIVEKESALEWLANNYKNYGTSLEFITNRSQEGSQFVRGFGGVGAILRYRVEFVDYRDYLSDSDSDFDEDDFL